jgi:hypothetical protein
MTCQCWKCFHELKSTREEFCPSCGIVSPYDGKQRVETLRGKARRSNKWSASLRIPFNIIGVFTIIAVCCIYIFWILPSSSNDLNYANPVVLDARASTNTFGCWILAIALAYLARRILKSAENRSLRLKEDFEKAEADLEKIHPAFYNENILLRPAGAPSSETLLRPARGTAETHPEQLVRAVAPEE